MTGRDVFSDIAGRYDLLNKLLSFGRDQAWRRKGARLLPPGRVLDLGAGTGAANPVFGARHIVALDPVPQMLARNPVPDRVVAVAEALPFGDGTFDGVFSAFVFRNLTSIPKALAEIARVLNDDGAAVVIDLARPPGRLARRVHRAGTAVTLPLAGAMIGARRQYAYLHHTLDSLPAPEVLFADGPLHLEQTWRMGQLGFVYGALLRKQ